ncbi:high mobility group box domain-containing protein, partial [Paraphysoderma sedebokerense]
MRAGLEEGTSQKRKRRRLKHPLQPKHPCSAFLFYLTAERSRVAAENPRCSVGQVSKLVGQKWRKMSASEKSSWEAKARADKERYAREMEIWNAT